MLTRLHPQCEIDVQSSEFPKGEGPWKTPKVEGQKPGSLSQARPKYFFFFFLPLLQLCLSLSLRTKPKPKPKPFHKKLPRPIAMNPQKPTYVLHHGSAQKLGLGLGGGGGGGFRGGEFTGGVYLGLASVPKAESMAESPGQIAKLNTAWIDPKTWTHGFLGVGSSLVGSILVWHRGGVKDEGAMWESRK